MSLPPRASIGEDENGQLVCIADDHFFNFDTYEIYFYQHKDVSNEIISIERVVVDRYKSITDVSTRKGFLAAYTLAIHKEGKIDAQREIRKALGF